MELEFKKDFEATRQRWDAFWRGESTGRPLVAVTVPKPAAQAPPPRPNLYGMFEKDTQSYIDRVLNWASGYEFLGEAVPFCLIDFGPDDFSALLGANLILSEDEQTTWVEPFVEDWDDADLTLKRQGTAWQRMLECIRAFRSRCDGRLLVSPPTIQGGLDALAAIRGVENLMMDLVMVPEKVHKALKVVDNAFDEVLDALCGELNVPKYGSITRHGMYSRNRTNVPQCDCSCMMSPAMFREFGLPSIAHMAKRLDVSTYHLDGPDAVKHLEAVCEIDEIDVIQWQPGAGEAAAKDWTDLYRKIDSLGKRQVLGGGGDAISNFEFIHKMCEQCDPSRLFFVVTAPSVREAESLLEQLEKKGW